ncbi:MAG TPA: hypothetical protein VLJ21_01670 [Candidatus Binatia bacterium]|nr:hypothetical protein [Candidatus Binatia bacterium]
MALRYMKLITKSSELGDVFDQLANTLKLPRQRIPVREALQPKAQGAYLQGEVYRIQRELADFETLTYRDSIITATFTQYERDRTLNYSVPANHLHDQRNWLERLDMSLARRVRDDLPRKTGEKVKAYTATVSLEQFKEAHDFILKHVLG